MKIDIEDVRSNPTDYANADDVRELADALYLAEFNLDAIDALLARDGSVTPHTYERITIDGLVSRGSVSQN